MIKDNVRPANVGVVRYQWTSGGAKGVVTNTVTDMFKEACARLLAGSTDWKPSHIGFIFGSVAAPTLDAPAETDTMDTVWTVMDDVSRTAGDRNTLIVPLAAIPEVTPGTGTSAIVFNGCSVAATTDNILDPAGRAAFTDGDYVYSVLLIARTVTGDKLLARAELVGYPAKTASRELAVYWQITMTTPVVPN